MRELRITGPLISKNVPGGGLLFMCPGSPEGRAAGRVVFSTLELLALGPWSAGRELTGFGSAIPSLFQFWRSFSNNQEMFLIEPSWRKKSCPTRLLNTMNEITLFQLF